MTTATHSETMQIYRDVSRWLLQAAGLAGHGVTIRELAEATTGKRMAEIDWQDCRTLARETIWSTDQWWEGTR